MVGSRPGIPSSGSFLLEQMPNSNGSRNYIKISTAASAVAEVGLTGTGTWPLRRPFYADRGIFSPFVNVAQEMRNKNRFQFYLKSGNLHIDHGNRYEDFLPQPSVMGYARLPKFKVKPNRLNLTPELLEMMKCAATCAASELQAPHLSCVYMVPTTKGVSLYATNLKVVFKASAAVELGEEVNDAIPFPLSIIDAAGADGVKSVLWAEDCAIAKFPGGRIWQTVSEQARTGFPVNEIRSSLEKGTKDLNVFSVSAYKFAKMVDRLTQYLQSVRKEDWVIVILSTQNANALSVLIKLPHVTIREKIGTLEPVKRDFRLEWPLDMIAPVLQFVGKDEEQIPLRVGLEMDGL